LKPTLFCAGFFHAKERDFLKKLLAILCCMAMLFTLFPMSAFAEGQAMETLTGVAVD
jgi:hypothetical protein